MSRLHLRGCYMSLFSVVLKIHVLPPINNLILSALLKLSFYGCRYSWHLILFSSVPAVSISRWWWRGGVWQYCQRWSPLPTIPLHRGYLHNETSMFSCNRSPKLILQMGECCVHLTSYICVLFYSSVCSCWGEILSDASVQESETLKKWRSIHFLE